MKDVAVLHRNEYGVLPEIIGTSPGVVTILGEHTQHAGGLALPIAISRTVKVALSFRNDAALKFFSANYNERKRSSLTNLKFKREDRWANYVKGVLHAFVLEGFALRGMDITIYSEVPAGIGLASSAALTLATACALKRLYQWRIRGERLVHLARSSEVNFMERETGTIDLLTAYFAKKNNALLVDTGTGEHRAVPLNLGDVRILITDSQVPSTVGDVEDAWKDCEKCMALLEEKRPGKTLRDLTARDIRESIGLFPEIIRRRCLHIVEENRRVKEAEVFFRRGDIAAVGKLLSQSHESLRDLFEISCPELDWLVKRSWEIDGVLGSRLTGSGFGGCTVTLLKAAALEEYVKRLDDYERIFGFKAEMFVCDASEGAKAIEAI